MADEQKPSYEDENVSEREKQSGQTRLPSPEQEGKGEGQERIEKPKTLNPDRSDEFGDGDRRS